MTSDSFLASLYTYPWDLADDGVDLALDRIADLAACGEVLLTPCYHRSEYYLPHNPRRPVYYGENGAVYFSPDLSRYEGTRISPRVSREVTDPAWFDRMVEAIRKRGLGFSAWMVYTFQNHLSERYPEFARHDAFGTPHVGALSTAPRDVRDYFAALTAEVLERFQPDAVWVESLCRRGFSMPGKRRAQMPERCRWLLSLCFNPASMAFADAAGLEAEALRRDLVEWMRPGLAAGADPDADEPATAAWIEEAFDGRLQRYMEISRRQTTDLWLDVVELIRARGAKVQADLASPERALTNDLDQVVNRQVDRLGYTLREGEDPVGRIRELEGMIADGGTVFLSPTGDMRRTEPIREQLAAARGAGAGGVTFYNYGLLTLEQLGNIGQALRSV